MYYFYPGFISRWLSVFGMWWFPGCSSWLDAIILSKQHQNRCDSTRDPLGEGGSCFIWSVKCGSATMSPVTLLLPGRLWRAADLLCVMDLRQAGTVRIKPRWGNQDGRASRHWWCYCKWFIWWVWGLTLICKPSTNHCCVQSSGTCIVLYRV